MNFSLVIIPRLWTGVGGGISVSGGIKVVICASGLESLQVSAQSRVLVCLEPRGY
jgi:hypothetical protein